MGKFPQSSTLWNGRRWWKNLGLIPSACERLGKHSLILQELSVWTFLLRASPPTQLNLWQLTSSTCFFLPSYPIPFPRGSRPCSSWLLNARPILPPTTPGSSLGPTLSTLLECSFLFSSSFGSTATRLTKQHSAHSAGFPGALQSGLNSYPVQSSLPQPYQRTWMGNDGCLQTLIPAKAEWRKRQGKTTAPQLRSD